MVTLKNVKRKGDIITCDIYPESEKEPGYCEFDVKTKKPILMEYAPYDTIGMYASHALSILRDMADVDLHEFKEVYRTFWY